MRIALVSPYSWTYPGGVTRHIEALAEQFSAGGHHVRVLAPFDDDDRRASLLHRGARPEPREAPDYLVPIGRSIGYPFNGAVSNLSGSPAVLRRARTELRSGRYDVVHLHEPVAPLVCWDALVSSRSPLVGTFHCYTENRVSNNVANLLGARRMLNHLHARIAVSEAAAWSGRRFFGGHYRIIPNGVDLDLAAAASRDRDAPPPPAPCGELRIAFVGQAVERKGLPVLLRAFEALREHVPARLTIVGAGPGDVAPLLLDDRGVTVLGKVSDEEKAAVLRDADVLCAPSLGGESFGMVLTEAFAAGTPVVASDIAGYRDVVQDGSCGVLVPRGDATALAEALRDLWLEPGRRQAMARNAERHAGRFAWPRVAEEVLETYEEAIAVPAPSGLARRAAVRVGALPADLKPRSPARRLPSLEPPLPGARRPAVAVARRAAFALAALAGVVFAVLALNRIGLDNIGRTLIQSSPAFVLLGLGLMGVSMAVRAVAWHAILRAALPSARLRLADAMQGTFIGVLMSATLPARLGEPSRALIVARRSGRPRENLPVVLGTLVSQTVLNIVALVLLGAVMFATVGLFRGHEGALALATLAPVIVLLLVVAAPALLRRGAPGEGSRGHRVQEWIVRARAALTRVRSGLRVFREPRLGAVAVTAQLSAWVLQWMSCYVLLVALGLDERAGLGAAAAVLFAVNVTAVLPATPSNLGVFQAACVAVLAGAYGVSSADALGFGIILQAVEIATAVIMGMPALVKEGLSWKDVRQRALHHAPVEIPARPSGRTGAVEAEA